MFVLGFLYWMYNRPMEFTERFLEEKFKSKPDILAANLKVLKAGYYFGDTREEFTTRYAVAPAKMPPGIYRNIMGNQATAIGLVAASEKSGDCLYFTVRILLLPLLIFCTNFHATKILE
jgi:2-oxoglutarate ferredoxin oxidoreductase subunit alpha